MAIDRPIEEASISPKSAIANASGASDFNELKEKSGVDRGGKYVGITPIVSILSVKLLK